MAAVFLRVLAGPHAVYEALLDSGQVSENPQDPGDLSSADRIEFWDPETGVRCVSLSIFPGTLKSHIPLWKKLEFQTRCFLVSAGSDSLAPVKVRLALTSATIAVTDFEVFDQYPLVAQALPSPIRGLPGIAFTSKFLAFTPPEVLNKLGLQGYAQATGWVVPQIHASLQENGIRFYLELPLPDQDDNDQELLPHKITFSSTDSSLSIGDNHRRVLPVSQRQANTVDGSVDFWVLSIGLPASIVLRNWNDSVAGDYLASLSTVRSGLPTSFVPTFSVAEGQQSSFAVTFSVLDKTQVKKVTAALCVLRNPESEETAGLLNILPRTIELPSGSSLKCIATFPNVMRTDGANLQASCELTPPKRPSADNPKAPAGYSLGFRHKFPPYPANGLPSSQPLLRMGGLDLLLPEAQGQQDLGRDPGALSASFRARRNDPDVDDLPGLVRLNTLDIQLAISSFGAGAQDDVPGEEYVPENEPYPVGLDPTLRRSPALQLSVDPNLPSIGDYFVMDARESCYETRSQTLDLRLEQQRLSAGNAKLDLVIIDPEPFLVARVSMPDYQQSLRDAVTDQIAAWNNRATSAAWQFATGNQTFELVLPPQGLTEAMHKRRFLKDVVVGIPVDFRFTPPARFQLHSSLVEQRYAEVPWNLRRVLGYPGQRAPGAPISEAVFELVYGMSGSLSKRPGLFLAEIASRLGALPSTQSDVLSWQHTDEQQNRYAFAKSYWEALAPRLRTRLAVLEPWDAAQPSGLTLTQQDKLFFRLRNQADLADPTVAGSTGLKGSYSWAFESDRIYHAVRSNPVSVSSELCGAGFSSLGGWGRFTARYDNGRTSIIASVRMGRVESLTIERIGRIGNFWNRAKHVITYSRTVAATRQFYLEQEPFLGVPILRKVAEYVELLQKRRDADQSKDTPGPLRACEFPEGDPPRIPVDSTWGENVGDFGYKIPLWKPGAQPPDVYPKPTAVLHLETSQANGSTCRSPILDPEKLCFYTTVNPNYGTDTDQWPKDCGADYGLIPAASVTPTPKPPLPSDGDVASFKAPQSDPWIEPALGPFTYCLDVPAQAANIVSGVAQQPVGATLRTITIMRGLDASGVLLSAAPVSAALEGLKQFITVQAGNIPGGFQDIDQVIGAVNAANASEAKAIIAAARSALDTALQNAHVTAPVRGQILSRFDDVVKGIIPQHVRAEVEQLTGHASNILRPLISVIPQNATPQELAQNWDTWTAEAVHRAQHWSDALNTFAKSMPQDGGKLCTLLTGQLERQLQFLEAQIENEVSGLISGAADLLKDLVGRLPDLKAQRQDVLKEWTAGRDSILAQLRFTRGQVESVFTVLNNSATAAIATVIGTLNQLDRDLSAIDAGVGGARDKATAAVRDAARNLDEGLAKADAETEQALRPIAGGQVDKIRHALGVARTDIAGVAAQAISDIADATSTPQAAIGKARTGVQAVAQRCAQYQTQIAGFVDSLKKAVQTFGQTTIEKYLDQITKALTDASDWDAFKAQAKDAIDGFNQKIKNTVAQHLKELNLQIDAFAELACQQVLQTALTDVLNILGKKISPASVQQFLDQLKGKLPSGADLRNTVENFLHGVESSAAQFVSAVRAQLPELPQVPPDVSKAALFLLRGFGDVPKVPQLSFKGLPFTAYRFAELDAFLKPVQLPAVNLTPLVAWANELGGAIGNPINLAVPSFQLADKLLPYSLQSFDWRTLIPHIAGLDLTNLFHGLRPPVSANDDVKVTHGIDPQSRSGWVEIDMDVSFADKPAQVLSYCGVTLTLLQARFVGSTRLQAALGQAPKRSFRGAITGNWDLRVGGYPVAVLAGCTLNFDDSGNFGFDVTADKVRLQGALEFLADLLSSFLSGGGFSTAITSEGLKTTLDLPLPDVQSGAFGLANLRLGFAFVLKISPFQLGISLALAKPERPFTLSIFILGGAGYVTLDLGYTPGTGAISARLSIGIFASASLAISLGPISGGVYAYFGITVAYLAQTRSAPDLQVAISLMFIGQVTLLGFISVSLMLSLSAQYRSGGQLTGRGRVSYSIKLGPFFSIDVSSDVSYTYSNSPAELLPSPGDYDAAAAEYVSMFYN